TVFIYSGIRRFIMRFPSPVKDYTEKELSLDE
ncbi:DNA polymerase V, partial [Salmonella enterica]